MVWALNYGKRVPAVVVSLADVSQPRQQQIKSRKVMFSLLQVNMTYVKLLGMVDKEENEVEVFTSSEREKLVLLGDSPQAGPPVR